MASVAWDDEAKPGPQAPQIQWDAPAAAPAESSPITRAYQSVAKPVTSLLARILEPTVQGVTAPFVDMQRYANGEAPGQILRNSATFGGAERPGAALPAAQSIAEIAVPQTPLQAGMMVGAMGAGRAAQAVPAVAALAKAHPALTRILGGTTGGSVGGAVGDEGAVRGAAEGAVGSTLGEGLGALLSRLRLAIPGGKRAANNADAARIGDTMGEIVPELAGARTVPDIRGMVEGQGRAALGQAKEGTTRAVEQSLPGVPGGLNPGEIPTPGALRGQTTYGPQTRPPAPPAVPEPYGTSTALGAEPTPPMPAYPGGGQVPRPVISATDTGMPLRQANDALTSIGEGAFNQNILDRGAKKAADRRLYGEVARDMQSGIATAGGPEAAGAFASGQTNYAQGTKMLDLLKRSGVVDSEGFLNVARIQRALNDPRVAAQLRGTLGEESFAKLSDAVYRGAPRGEVDRMTSGQGGALDALMQVLRGQNTGAAQFARIPIATILPNLGSKYVGRNPLALPEGLRTILDVGAQRGVDEAMR